MSKTCIRCGRKLKSQKSLEREFGPKCYKKWQKELMEIGLPENQVTIDEVLEGESHGGC